jgi:hypothetical protein
MKFTKFWGESAKKNQKNRRCGKDGLRKSKMRNNLTIY